MAELRQLHGNETPEGLANEKDLGLGEREPRWAPNAVAVLRRQAVGHVECATEPGQTTVSCYLMPLSLLRRHPVVVAEALGPLEPRGEMRTRIPNGIQSDVLESIRPVKRLLVIF